MVLLVNQAQCFHLKAIVSHGLCLDLAVSQLLIYRCSRCSSLIYASNLQYIVNFPDVVTLGGASYDRGG